MCDLAWFLQPISSKPPPKVDSRELVLFIRGI